MCDRFIQYLWGEFQSRPDICKFDQLLFAQFGRHKNKERVDTENVGHGLPSLPRVSGEAKIRTPEAELSPSYIFKSPFQSGKGLFDLIGFFLACLLAQLCDGDRIDPIPCTFSQQTAGMGSR